MNIIEKKKRQMGQGGFTLIELLVVIAILAVLAGLAVIGIGAMRDNAEKTACQADADTLTTAAEAALITNSGLSLTNNNGAGIVDGSGSKLIKSGREASKARVTVAGGVVSTSGC